MSEMNEKFHAKTQGRREIQAQIQANPPLRRELEKFITIRFFQLKIEIKMQ